jgi:4-hydroxy-4-methyl-2-oxoglutarate aldolase
MVVDGGMFWLGKVTPTGMPAYFRGTGPESLSGVMPGDVVLGDEEGLFFIPPHLVKDAIDAAAGTKARDEWSRRKWTCANTNPWTCTALRRIRH